MVPSYPDKKTVARELDCCETTVDEMVKRGVLPPPVKLSSGCVRFDWADVQRAIASLKPSKDGAVADPYSLGARNVKEAQPGPGID